VVEHLPSICKVLGWILSLKKERKDREEKLTCRPLSFSFVLKVLFLEQCYYII
jgi:hypothetical protein